MGISLGWWRAIGRLWLFLGGYGWSERGGCGGVRMGRMSGEWETEWGWCGEIGDQLGVVVGENREWLWCGVVVVWGLVVDTLGRIVWVSF